MLIIRLRIRHATDESDKINKEIGISTKDYDDKLKNYEKIKQSFDKIKVICRWKFYFCFVHVAFFLG